MATEKDVTGSANPKWLDQVLGTGSPPFSFRRGGSAITGKVANDSPTQQSGSAPSKTEPATGRQRG